MMSTLRFKIATEPGEYEQIHRFNHATFAGEIPQHPPDVSGRLVDRHHPENTYVICLHEDRLIGMVAVRSARPFSLDRKLPDLDAHLPPGHSVCEIRLLAVDRRHRHTPVLMGLISTLHDFCKQHGFTLAVISGITRQAALYAHLGFRPFGPLVGSGTALFQPMYLTMEEFDRRSARFFRPASHVAASRAVVNVLPGPVAIRPTVRRALDQTPVSHRSDEFLHEMRTTKQLLCRLVNAGHVEILLGSGTLANDAIAGQLSLLPGRGLILSNGEFGDRLIDQAARFKLSYETMRVAWGHALNPRDIRRLLDHHQDIGWLWAVHCETSTGMLNDLETLQTLCRERVVKLCLDCISSLGIVPLGLSGVYLASGVSGKGLGAFPGLSMVFYNHPLPPSNGALPRYLDLSLYAACDGVPFTGSSNLLTALSAALSDFDVEARWEACAHLSRWIRSRLHALGFRLVGSTAQTSPAVITIQLPPDVPSLELGSRLERQGILLSYHSRYLLERNWIQICLMGQCSRRDLERLLTLLAKLVTPSPAPPHRSVRSKPSELSL
jgi:aspartate aminotransferase-like enzyme/GNAT superfamily N-acetyltransferase